MRKQLGKTALAAFTAVALGVLAYLAITQFPSAGRLTAAAMLSASSVASSHEQDRCRRYKWDEVAGRMIDDGTGACSTSSDGQAGRLKAISESFRN
jgi:hypothetical protein